MKKIVMAALAALSVGGVSAQNVYMGASVGQTHFDADCDGIATCDKGSTGYKVYAGYRVHKFVSVEAGYADFGDAHAQGMFPVYGNIRAKVNSQGAFAAGVLRMAIPDSDTEAMVRLGIISVKTRASLYQIDVDASGTLEERTVRPFIGVGLNMGITKNVSATFEVDLTKSAEVDVEEISGNLRMISVGLQVKF